MNVGDRVEVVEGTTVFRGERGTVVHVCERYAIGGSQPIGQTVRVKFGDKVAARVFREHPYGSLEGYRVWEFDSWDLQIVSPLQQLAEQAECGE